MSAVFTFILIGLGTGAAYAGISMGLVVVYKGSGTINFAAGAMAAWGAYAFAELRSEGLLFLPIPINQRSQLGADGYGGLPLFLFTVVAMALFWALFRLIIGRPVTRRWPATARIVGIVGIVGALGWGVYAFIKLRSDGVYYLPLLPYRFDFGRVSFVVALIVVLVLAGLIGLAAHLVVFRPMRKAPPLAKVVASVGLMTTMLALIGLRFSNVPQSVGPIFPAQRVSFGYDISVPRDRLFVAATAVLIAVLLHLYFRYTRYGAATRAAAENERNAALGGWSPDLLAGTTWVMSGVLSTFLVIVTLPILPLSQTLHTLMIVPALACALVGRLTSVGATVAAALGLGSLQAVLTNFSSRTWWPEWAHTGLGDAVPFLVLIIVLIVLGQSLPTRATLLPDPLPRIIVPRNRPQVIVPLVAVALGLLLLTQGSWRFAVITTLIFTIATMSIVLLTGLTGQISLAQAALAGTAGFAMAKLSSHGLGFPWVVIVAAAIAAGFGVIVGLPALRIRGARLAVVTLALAVAIERFLFRNPAISNRDGEPVPSVHFLGMDLSVREGRTIARWQFGVLVLIVVVLVGLAVSNIIRSGTGRRLIALRGNEKAAAAVGVNVAASKLLAFGLAAFLAGLAGCFIGYSRNQLSADSFSTFANVNFVAFAYLGGITSVSGAIIGAFLAPLALGYLLTDRLFQLGPNYSLVAGIGLIVTAALNPIGIAGANREMYETLVLKYRKKHPRRGADAPSAVSDTPCVFHRSELPAARDARELLLRTIDLSVTYGGVKAVADASVDVRRGEMVGLIGPNGAGKTSFMDGLTGFTRTTGRIEFLGLDLAHLPPHQRVRRGLSRTWQSVELFNDLTVRENLSVASEWASVRSFLADVVHPARNSDQSGVDFSMRLMGLTASAHASPTDLSLGHQKLVGVARGLCSRPRVLLLDEPAAGLDTNESLELGGKLRDIASDGTAILLIDHDMGLVLDTCDYVYVLEFGRIIFEGTPDEIRRSDVVIRAYLGESAVSPRINRRVAHL